MNKAEFTRCLTQEMESQKQRLFRYACYRTGSVDEAEDILQDLYLRLLEHYREGADVKNLSAYIFRSLVNICSSRPFEPPQVGIDSAEAAGVGNDDESFEEESERIRILVDQMPEETREVIRLRIYADLTFDEVAETLSISPTSAKRRYYRGLDSLRKLYNTD